MDVSKVIAELEKKYPGKAIFKNGSSNPTEIICEVEPSSDHPDYSVAVAVIDQSQPHYHKKTFEIYEIIKGKLELTVDRKVFKLSQGEVFKIPTGKIHSTRGDETWVQVTSHPGWTPEDHILV